MTRDNLSSPEEMRQSIVSSEASTQSDMTCSKIENYYSTFLTTHGNMTVRNRLDVLWAVPLVPLKRSKSLNS